MYNHRDKTTIFWLNTVGFGFCFCCWFFFLSLFGPYSLGKAGGKLCSTNSPEIPVPNNKTFIWGIVCPSWISYDIVSCLCHSGECHLEKGCNLRHGREESTLKRGQTLRVCKIPNFTHLDPTNHGAIPNLIGAFCKNTQRKGIQRKITFRRIVTWFAKHSMWAEWLFFKWAGKEEKLFTSQAGGNWPTWDWPASQSHSLVHLAFQEIPESFNVVWCAWGCCDCFGPWCFWTKRSLCPGLVGTVGITSDSYQLLKAPFAAIPFFLLSLM